MDITVVDRQEKLAPATPQIISFVKKVLKQQKIERAALSFVLVGEREIKALNKKFLGRGYATDVLAFELDPSAEKYLKAGPAAGGKKILYGEVVISTDAVVKNSQSFKTTAARELALYIIHGILHLSGFDDHAARDVKKMRGKEQELLARAGLAADKLLL